MEYNNLALTIVKPGKMVLQPLKVPEVKNDEVLVKIRYVAVCGSDIKLYAGTYTAPHKYPIIMGHEWMGTVIKSGKNVDIQEGQQVVGDCSVFCDECYYCGVNKNHCETIEKRGITIDGGAANYIVVKAKHVNCCPQMEDERLLTLAEPMSVAVTGILNRVPKTCLKRMRRALILGAGGIGLMSLFTLLEAGIPEIVIVDMKKNKIQRVIDFGIQNVVPVCCEEKHIESLGLGAFDLIVEATGNIECLQETVSLANPCAHIVCLGHQVKMEYDLGSVVKKSLTIYGSNGSTGGFDMAMELIKKYSSYIEKMITATIPFSKAPKLFEKTITCGPNIKVLIDMEG